MSNMSKLADVEYQALSDLLDSLPDPSSYTTAKTMTAAAAREIKMERHVTGARTGYVFDGKYYVYTSCMHDIYCVFTMYIKEF